MNEYELYVRNLLDRLRGRYYLLGKKLNEMELFKAQYPHRAEQVTKVISKAKEELRVLPYKISVLEEILEAFLEIEPIDTAKEEPTTDWIDDIVERYMR